MSTRRLLSSSTEKINRMSSEDEMESLDHALERVNQRRWWIWGVFLVASSPGVFNAWHIMVSLFLSNVPPHWCDVPQLSHWTKEQIRNISSPEGLSKSSCSLLDWNYTQLAALGYESAVQFTSSEPRPPSIPCPDAHYSFEEEVPFSSTVTEWSLVCDRLPLKSNIQSSIALGKFIGGFLFGFIADKYGRKTSFVLSCLTYILSGPIAALVPSYWLFIVARFFIGIAGSGCYEAAYTVLTEVSSKERRTMLGCIYNMAYPLGYIMLSAIAIMFPAWRTLQLAISLPMLVLFLHCWLLPESPRWLLTQGRNKEAWSIMKTIDKSVVPPQSQDFTNVKVEKAPVPLLERITTGTRQMFKLFATPELCRRICISYFTWFVAALSYYALALNADNFSNNRYIYLALSGAVEAPSYLLPLLILMWLGRKSTGALLFLISGIALICILFISPENKSLIMMVALLGRFTDCAVFAVIILQTSELFPTSNRNTAIGTSLAVSQLGSISAPYVVDILGKQAWYVPSTLCGGLALSSALLILLLPETRDRPLMDTVQDLKHTHHSDRVSFRNCCSFS